LTSVKIVTNSYDAEDGRFSGAQIQIISKSGNQRLPRQSLSHQPPAGPKRPSAVFNGEGASGNERRKQVRAVRRQPSVVRSGKNKIFAFFNYETVREPSSPLQGNGWFETPAFAALAPCGESIGREVCLFPG